MQRPLTILQDINHNSFAIKCNANQNWQRNYVSHISTLLHHLQKIRDFKNFHGNNNYKYLNIYGVPHYYILKTISSCNRN